MKTKTGRNWEHEIDEIIFNEERLDKIYAKKRRISVDDMQIMFNAIAIIRNAQIEGIF